MHQNSQLDTMGTLYVVATPIGNLRDITLRALDVLAKVDVIAAEDTRNTSNLLRHFSLSGQLFALHEHNERSASEKLIAMLHAGKSVALVSDAGTPAVSDPGAVLVQLVRQAGLKVVPVPGANAAIAAISAAGIIAPHFYFYGFLPHKSSGRKRELELLKMLTCTLIFYESPHRILESVEDLLEMLGGERQIIFARELTKVFETIYSCRLSEALAWLKADPNQQRGEFVLLVSGATPVETDAISDEARRVLRLLLAELPLKQAAKLAAEISGAKKNDLYALALVLKGESEV